MSDMQTPESFSFQLCSNEMEYDTFIDSLCDEHETNLAIADNPPQEYPVFIVGYIDWLGEEDPRYSGDINLFYIYRSDDLFATKVS